MGFVQNFFFFSVPFQKGKKENKNVSFEIINFHFSACEFSKRKEQRGFICFTATHQRRMKSLSRTLNFAPGKILLLNSSMMKSLMKSWMKSLSLTLNFAPGKILLLNSSYWSEFQNLYCASLYCMNLTQNFSPGTIELFNMKTRPRNPWHVGPLAVDL